MDCEGAEKYMINDKDSEAIIKNCLQFGMELHFQSPKKTNRNFYVEWNEMNDWIMDSFQETHEIIYHKSNKNRGYGHYKLKRKN